ncbi:Probable protein kinase UbiB (Ubiquinone biosynthesis protein UbiB) [Durusdinium trenchii]|uniref:Probable protein kinase UbiB (Ubiquinone biosynthesis protein UbiB) n=1 Tax=Durusdinium trenchii TaxID=1381693 RepID=A0ABP0LRP2_9DINO
MFNMIADYARLARAAWTLARHDALIPNEFAHLTPTPLRAFGAVTRIGAKGKGKRPGERLANAFERLGPAYVKLGQFMATRPDIIGFELAADLGRLQDKMPPFSDAAARKEIEIAFGKTTDALFAEFSPPIAAASIAQAHRATLASGAKVAVKILRPNIERKAASEFRAFARAARNIETVSKTARRMEPLKFIETLKESAAIELDLRMEAGAASELAENLRDDPKVRVPDVIWQLSARRVLTIEWIDGTPIADTEALDKRGVDRKALAKLVISTFLNQALHHGFFHADMHQGNLLIDTQGRLALVDFGIMGRLDEKARQTFAEIIYGFITRNYRRTAEVHFDAGYVPEGHSVEAFAQALRAVGEPLYGKNAANVDMSRVLQQLFDVTALFDMHLRPELVLLQRTMVTAEGVARLLDPEVDIWDAATPTVRAYINNAIGPKAQAEKLKTAGVKAAELAPRLPDYIEDIGTAAKRMNETDAAGPKRPTQETKMFGFKFGAKKKAEPAGEYVTARLNARVQPIDRGDYYEDPLHDMLQDRNLGGVTGGGTQLADEPAGIEFCDLEINVYEISDETLQTIADRLEALGAPKGSKLIVESTGREIPFGKNEGIAVYLNGVDLPDEVYDACDFDTVVSEFDRLMGDKGAYRGYWQGSRETGVYCYGASYQEMKAAIDPFLNSYPLCQRARVEQIA